MNRVCEDLPAGVWLEVTRVTGQVLEAYQRWLHHFRKGNGAPLSVRTQLSRLSCLRSFYAWLEKRQLIPDNPAAGLQLPRQPVRLPVDGFSSEEAERILATPNISKILGLRDRAALETLYSTAVRRTELSQLDVYDVDFGRGWLTVRKGKGGRDRVVPIGDRAVHWLRRYLRESRPRLEASPEEKALFLALTGRRFTPNGLGNRIAKNIKASGVRNRYGSCHLFRHATATLMFENGADIRYIQNRYQNRYQRFLGERRLSGP